MALRMSSSSLPAQLCPARNSMGRAARDGADRISVAAAIPPSSSTHFSPASDKAPPLTSASASFSPFQPTSLASRNHRMAHESRLASTNGHATPAHSNRSSSPCDGDAATSLGTGGDVRDASSSSSSSDGDAASGTGGSLRGARQEADFVRWFREAWPYIQGHRGSTFVIVMPGEVVANQVLFDTVLQDIALMHGLGVKLVLVPGAQVQIDEQLREQGLEPVYEGAYRVTDAEALEAAMEAAGRIRIDIEAKLSRGPVIPVLRRHGENEKWHEVGISVASGNFAFAKRRGVVGGVDFGATGEVKKVDVERIRSRLDNNCVVLLSNLGFCPSGEVLNCNAYEVATLAATALHADKLICLLDGPVVDPQGRLIRWMTLQQADMLIRQRASQSYTAADYIQAVGGVEYVKSLGLSQEASSASKKKPAAEESEAEAAASLARWKDQRALYTMEYPKPLPLLSNAKAKANETGNGALNRSNSNGNGNGNGSGNGRRGFPVGGAERISSSYGYLPELTAAVFACRGGVRRVHLLDSSLEGALLLELYTRDGIGTMVSSDLYEGTRAAQRSDLRGIQALLQPLEEAGVLVKRSEERLIRELPYFTVVERDGALIACAALVPFPEDKVAEVAAFAVSPAARGHGRGDNLLDYLERRAKDLGMSKLFLLTTRTADWFVQRGFAPCPLEALPQERQRKIDRNRGSKSFLKVLSVEAGAMQGDSSALALPTDLPEYGPKLEEPAEKQRL